MKFIPTPITLLIAASLALATSAQAQSTADHSAHHAAAASAASAPTATSAGPASSGEVRKVDKEQGKLTLRHGPIANLDMPGMTMVFKVADRKWLDAVKVGDKVRFTAEDLNGVLTVTALEVAP